MRGMEMRAAATGTGTGATAATFGCGASVGRAVAGALGDGDGDGLAEAVARTFVDDTASFAGERLTKVAAMASKSRTQTDVRTRRPRLTPPWSPGSGRLSIELRRGAYGRAPARISAL